MSGGQAAGDGSSATGTKGLARSRWLSRRAIRLHLTLLIAGSGCLAAGWFEFTRARAGNELSWVYVFEWPFFAGFGCYLWWRLLHEDDRSRARPAADPAGLVGVALENLERIAVRAARVGVWPGQLDDDGDDVGLGCPGALPLNGERDQRGCDEP